MSDDASGTWYELLPDGNAASGAERYGERAAAEQAATAMLIRQPDLRWVDIAECSEGAPAEHGRPHLGGAAAGAGGRRGRRSAPAAARPARVLS